MSKVGAERGFGLPHKADFNIVPLVGVLLALVIAFLLAAPSGLAETKLDLPPPPGDFPPPRIQPAVVALQPDGEIFVDSKAVTLADLNAAVDEVLQARRAAGEDVLVKAGRDAKYEDFAIMVSTLKQGGHDHLGLVTENLG